MLRRARKPTLPNNTSFKPQTYYALRYVESGRFVDARKIKAKDHHGVGRFFVANPPESDEPLLNASRETVETAWITYETDRAKRLALHGRDNREAMEMVTFRTDISTDTISQTPKLDPMRIKALLIGHHYGLEAYNAFTLARDKTDVSQYTMFLRRKGGKALMDELMFDNFSYGTVTFLRDETELVQARLILGDSTPARVFDIINFPLTVV